ncbi:MAG: class II aldolase/adducin family protein [Pseudomonadota bacterium]|nr:class II aldolase/adducin family protein [Pseudomonadota bacterium]
MNVVAMSPENVPSMHGRVSEVEWDARVQLAGLYRIAACLGLEDLTANHFSARVPDAPNHFLIKPTALLFSEVTASNLCCYDENRKLVYETGHTSSPAGPRIHGSVLNARPDVMATMHLHTTAGAAVSAMDCGLKFISQASMRFAGQVAYHLYEGLVHKDDEGLRLVADLGDKHVMFLENHGTLITGRSIPECFLLHHYLERACEIQVAAMSSGAALKEPPMAECLKMAQGWSENRPPPHDELVGDRDFQAMVRKVEAIDPGFRE